MRQPTIYLARTIRRWDCAVNHPTLGWIPARPMGHNLFGLMQRWKTAFAVLIGKYDALDWEDQP